MLLDLKMERKGKEGKIDVKKERGRRVRKGMKMEKREGVQNVFV